MRKHAHRASSWVVHCETRVTRPEVSQFVPIAFISYCDLMSLGAMIGQHAVLWSANGHANGHCKSVSCTCIDQLTAVHSSQRTPCRYTTTSCRNDWRSLSLELSLSRFTHFFISRSFYATLTRGIHKAIVARRSPCLFTVLHCTVTDFFAIGLIVKFFFKNLNKSYI